MKLWLDHNTSFLHQKWDNNNTISEWLNEFSSFKQAPSSGGKPLLSTSTSKKRKSKNSWHLSGKKRNHPSRRLKSVQVGRDCCLTLFWIKRCKELCDCHRHLFSEISYLLLILYKRMRIQNSSKKGISSFCIFLKNHIHLSIWKLYKLWQT